MAKYFWIIVCVGFASLLTKECEGLNPAFDKESLGLQGVGRPVNNPGPSRFFALYHLVMTDWKSAESIYELVDLLMVSIPMNLSTTCASAVRNFTFDLMNKQSHAIKMVDAFGKTPSGIMLGHILLFGHFDQCLGIRRFNNATGQFEQAANYCLVRMRHPDLLKKVPALPAYGACLPIGCDNQHDANAFVTGLFKPMRAAEKLEAVQGVCVTPLTRSVGFYIIMAICGLIVLVVVIASFVHCVYRRRFHTGVTNGTDDKLMTPVQIYDQKVTSTNGLTIHQHTELSRKSKFGYANVPPFLRPLLCFHIPTNVRTIGSMANEGEIGFLHGFRVLSMWWIILGHTYYLGMNFFENRITFYQAVKSLGFQIVLNAGYAVDGFFLLSGLLITYVLLRELHKNDGRLNWLLVYFHRWWRLTPVYVFVMCFYVYVLPHGVNSPWKLIIQQQGSPTDNCKAYWWTNILYINNFFPAFRNFQCMAWTWFLALDMQFFLITPPLVFVLYKARAAGMAIIAALILACVITTMTIIGYLGLPVHFLQDPLYDPGYNETLMREYGLRADDLTNVDIKRLTDVDHIYEKPYTRITPFLIGVLLGYLFVKIPRGDLKLPGGRLIAAAAWVLSTAVVIPLLFGFHFAGWYDEIPPQDMGLGARVAYGGLQRLGWSLVMAWILFACNYGYGGYITNILSLRLWRPLSNLTYGAYLVHMLTLQLYFASQRHMIFYSTLNMLTIFFGQLVLSYFVAFMFAIFVEVPLLRLERLIVKKSL